MIKELIEICEEQQALIGYILEQVEFEDKAKRGAIIASHRRVTKKIEKMTQLTTFVEFDKTEMIDRLKK